MAIVTKTVIFVAFICAVSAFPAMNGQQNQEGQVNLLSIDDVPLQDDRSTGQVRDKRMLFNAQTFFNYPVVSYGYGGKREISVS